MSAFVVSTVNSLMLAEQNEPLPKLERNSAISEQALDRDRAAPKVKKIIKADPSKLI